jgi:hypothetical protein
MVKNALAPPPVAEVAAVMVTSVVKVADVFESVLVAQIRYRPTLLELRPTTLAAGKNSPDVVELLVNCGTAAVPVAVFAHICGGEVRMKPNWIALFVIIN